MTAYVVDVKPSARRTNAAVGRAVNRDGTRRRFLSRADAETWALGLSARGDRRVWIRAANPNDRTGADAYLVGRRRRRADDGGGEGTHAGASDTEAQTTLAPRD
ncbi:MAG: hypothetical protein ABEJ81_04100 [Haloferacaceae archaeon]